MEPEQPPPTVDLTSPAKKKAPRTLVRPLPISEESKPTKHGPPQGPPSIHAVAVQAATLQQVDAVVALTSVEGPDLEPSLSSTDVGGTPLDMSRG